MTTLDKGGTVLANIHHHVISHISDPIYGVTGYYSDNDSTQHVVAATTDGTLYEIHWNRNTAPTSPQRLAHRSAPADGNPVIKRTQSHKQTNRIVEPRSGV